MLDILTQIAGLAELTGWRRTGRFVVSFDSFIIWVFATAIGWDSISYHLHFYGGSAKVKAEGFLGAVGTIIIGIVIGVSATLVVYGAVKSFRGLRKETAHLRFPR